MLPYSFRLAIRHFARKKIYSSIIVLSLTTGFACTCLLVSFLISERNVDSFHSKKDRIYQLSSNDPFNGSLGTGRINFITAQTKEYLESTYPEVENVCQVRGMDHSEIDINNELFPVNVLGVDSSFVTMFDFPSAKALPSNGMIIKSEKAKQLFGTDDVVGKIVSLKANDSLRLLTITGVIGETKERSHLNFDILVGRKDRTGGVTYLLLGDKTDHNAFLSKLNSDSLRPTLMANGSMDYFLDPLTKTYTSTWNVNSFISTRSETFLNITWIVCGLILFMACFNFVNLFLLSLHERRKETGIQKTLGISLWQTMRGAAAEAGLYIGLSVVASIALAYAVLPVFNSSLKTEIEFGYLFRANVMAVIIGIVIMIMICVIIVTTIRQRKVVPVSMMQNLSQRVRFSKIFFTLQFFVSITLCVCTITIIKQMKYLENEPLGFNRNIIQVNSPRKQPKQLIADLKNNVAAIPGVEHVALSQGNPISGIMIYFLKTEDGKQFNPYLFQGDEDMLKTLDLKLVQGSMTLNDDVALVNETLVKQLGIKDPIGTKLPERAEHIGGVVKDFTCSSFKQEIPPVILEYKAESKNLLIDYGQSDVNTILPKIESEWRKIYPDNYFDHRVLQDDLMRKYSEETLFYKIVLSASVTSMIISCFGLFALSWAVIRSRAKEMGIRKVLGASVADVLGLLTVSFAKRLLLAFILAAPVGYYLMNLWLSRFVNRAPIDSWVFVFTAIALATIAIVTLGFQTLRASLSSPLEEIKE